MYGQWKNVDGYSGKYRVSSLGNVMRIFKSGKCRLLTPYRKKMAGSQRLIVKLTDENGKSKEVILMQIVAKAFLGPCPDGCVPYHKNGCQSDNYIANIDYISREKLGRKTGALSRKQSVVKINHSGEIEDVYLSARDAGRQNYMSYQTIIDRCNGKCKSAFAPDGFAYAWEDKEVSIKNAMKKIEYEKSL